MALRAVHAGIVASTAVKPATVPPHLLAGHHQGGGAEVRLQQPRHRHRRGEQGGGAADELRWKNPTTSLGTGVATLVWKRVKEAGGAASARR
jgi:hypothetical protein